MLRILLPGLLLFTASCAETPQSIARADAAKAADQARLDKELAGRTPGKPVDCIDQRSINSTNYGQAIVYKPGGRNIYVNHPTQGCFGLKRDDIIVTVSYGGRLCRGDIMRTVDRFSGFPSGACTVGQFTPYSKTPS